ncbi:MAG: 4-alpha-glucanotransferase [Spirochaetaceae bacterium]|jgi:4-alpha-glucanotransferase|nr:4-alpha-glucanotransferase [Spirochaetaceae bacterium]
MSEISTDKRLLGIAVPLGALRGQVESAVGEYPDLIELAQFAAKTGVGIIQLLPVNDTGYESSPYGALSAFALNPIYLRISDIAGAAQFKDNINALNAKFANEKRFPYYKIAKAKIDILHEIFDAGKDKIVKDVALDVWTKKNDWVKSYAVFRRLKDLNDQKSWKEWKSHKKVSAKDIDSLWNDPRYNNDHSFWCWVQYLCDKQFSAAAEKIAALGVILKGDLPILLNEDSADVWSHPEYFHENLCAGAPPDFYSPEGQNWGFPIYNWQGHQKDNFAWWKARLKSAERYFKAYRIDHILGFFRIWAVSRRDISAMMGRFVPYIPITEDDLRSLGYDAGRIKWVSNPHIPTHEVWESVKNRGGANDDDVHRLFDFALDRIGNEELWIFKSHIKCEKDIEALDIHPAGREYLLSAWRDRIFNEYEKNTYAPVWYYEKSRAWKSFNDGEKEQLQRLLDEKKVAAEKKWETQGKKLLSVLVENTSMLACAEDLGALSDCVPRVLSNLKILSLRVVRWTRDYKKEGEPYIAYNDYAKDAVCTLSVHDSTTLREWWEGEADQATFAAFNGSPSLPKVYNPGTARLFLKNAAASASRFFIVQLVDMLHLSPKWYTQDPSNERINVPGTANEFNWTWRLPAAIQEIAKDSELTGAVKELEAQRLGKVK